MTNQMKYHISIQNKHKDTFTIFSLDSFECTEKDIEDFTKVLEDTAVRKYITDQVMEKYGFKSIKDLATDILEKSAEKWENREELRFIIKKSSHEIVGIIGIDLDKKGKNELWYFKISTCPPFMLQALVEVLKFLRQEKLMDLIATYKTDNTRSIEILKKLGFKETSNENEMEYLF
jgi:RimJ/RimL family protein N-acetyltransferase